MTLGLSLLAAVSLALVLCGTHASDSDGLAAKSLRGSLSVLADPVLGNFSVFFGSQLWLASSDEVSLRLKGRSLSLRDRSLRFLGLAVRPSEDNTGEEYLFHYGLPDASPLSLSSLRGESPLDLSQVLLQGSLRVSSTANNLFFAQFFPQELVQTATGDEAQLASSFPAFVVRDEHAGEAFAQWISAHDSPRNTHTDTNTETVKEKEGERSDSNATLSRNTDNDNNAHRESAEGFLSPRYGLWNAQLHTALKGGVSGTGVLAVFQSHSPRVCVLSPLTHALSVSLRAAPYLSSDDSSLSLSPASSLSYGLTGSVNRIPSGLRVQMLLHCGEHGVAQTMRDWGAAVRQFHRKPSLVQTRTHTRDVTLQYLGYTTEHGQYYYYNNNKKNYEDSLFGVAEYAKKAKIPYKYVSLGSWWYEKSSESGGVKQWAAKAEDFPHGLGYLHKKTGWAIKAQNRHWANDNVNAKENGGKYDFLHDRATNVSLPVDSRFWEELFSAPAKEWALSVYEQDWLAHQTANVASLLEDVSLAEDWLASMAQGAKKHGLSVQYAMSHVGHLLASLQFDAVTQARASGNYALASQDGENPNWRIGGQSLLLEALGLVPFKGGFLSTERQSGNPYGEDRLAPSPRLHAAVATLSAGPVAIGDGVGFSDAALIMKSCMKDGRLLQPSAPATPIDAVFKESAFQRGTGPQGDVWFAPSFVKTNNKQKMLRYGLIFVANLQKDWEIRPADLGVSYLENKDEIFFVTEANHPLAVKRFSNSQPLTLKACGTSDFQLYNVVPVLKNRWGFLGELDKWTPVTSARVLEVVADDVAVRVMVRGAQEETVHMGFVHPSGKAIAVSCKIKKGHDVVMVFSTGSCL